MQVFSNIQCKLGEAPLWHPERLSLFWVDILEQKLYEKKIHSANPDYDDMWEFDIIVSAIACKTNSSAKIWLVTNKGLALLNLTNGQYSIEVPLNLPEGFRSNDAHVGPDRAFWIGTMQNSPTTTAGSLYKITQYYEIQEVLSQCIGIPNTLCWSQNGKQFYLSDSLLQKMFVFDFPINTADIKKTFVDLSEGKSTPDGGAMDTSGNLWNAQWGGGCVVAYNHHGSEIFRLELPVPKPTSCCFGGENDQILFITSASDGLTPEAPSHSPQSGNVFMFLAANHQGTPVNSF